MTGNTPSPREVIDLWPFLLDESPQRREALLSSLAADELGKIDQGIFPEIGQRTAMSRVGLRRILESYVGIPSQEIRFTEGKHGKPSLETDPISFNLSHTGKHALLAVSSEDDLGVDLERIRLEAPIDDLAQRCFSECEFEQWNQLPQDQKLISFFHLWAQKEAFVKALGGGMTIPLKSFDCEVDPAESAGIINSRIDADRQRNWRVLSGNIGVDLRYAIVWDGVEKSIVIRNPETVGLSRW
ncbi:MAG: 4'-phosphopantetheinyl transferase superfamily protein [Planctomycetota bacterium]